MFSAKNDNVKIPHSLQEYITENFPHDEPDDSIILFEAAADHESAVVKSLLDMGANPLIRINGCLAIDHAVMAAIAAGEGEEARDRCKSAAYLLVYALLHSVPVNNISAQHIIDELMKLKFTKSGYREAICRFVAGTMKKDYAFGFTEKDLMVLLKKYEKTISPAQVKYAWRIGEGAQGNIYQGKLLDAKNAEIPVAVKFGKEYIVDYELGLEAYYHSKLLHPNIVKYYGLLEKFDDIAIVMALANRGSLHQHIHADTKISDEQKIPLNIETIYQIAKQIIAGMQYVHDLQYVLRDLKPENILVNIQNNETQIWLADFFTMKMVGEVTNGSKTTLLYCPPEAFYEGYVCKTSLDIFSFGVLLGEMDSKKFPANPDLRTKEIIKGLKDQRYPDFCGEKLSEGIDDIVAACIQFDENKRPDCRAINRLLDTELVPKFFTSAKEKDTSEHAHKKVCRKV